MDFYQELEIIIKAKTSIIYIITNEEERLEYILKDFVRKDISQAIHSWDFIEGYGNTLNVDKIASRNPLQALNTIESFSDTYKALFLLKDFDRFFNDNSVSRKLQNLSRKISQRNQAILIVSAQQDIELESAEFITSIYLNLPNRYEIKLELTYLFTHCSLTKVQNDDFIDSLSYACQGLSIIQIRSIIAKFLVQNQILDKNTINFFIGEKQQRIKDTSQLELCSSNISLDEIGGLHSLKEWLARRLSAFSSASIHYGLPYPKGLILVGIQGTGKSMTAKATATFLGLSLLRLDIGALFGGVVGESELNLRQAIRIVEASSPCVLWIDEIDKAFNRNIGLGDGGTSGRVLGTLLTWLSEKKCPVFIVATANNIEYLPSEIIRKGRFDEIFFIDLPNVVERKQIFEVQLSKLRPKTWHRYNTGYLAKCAVLFSGAEIEQVIIEAMYLSFMENRELNSEDILNEINNTVPLAFTDQINVSKLQHWANLGKARIA